MGFFGDAFNTLTGHQFDSSVKPTQSEKDAGTKGDAARSAAQTVSRTLGQNYHGEYIPETVSPLMENFDGMSHDDIIKYQGSIDIQGLNDSVTAWNNIANGLHSKSVSFQGAIEKELDSGWSGATADAAKASVRKFADDVDSLKNAAQIVASKMNDATATLTQVKNQIPGKPESADSSFFGKVTEVLSPVTVVGHIMTDHGRASNAQNEARDVMNNVYKKYVPDANTRVPKMPGVTTADKNPGSPGPTGPAQSSNGPGGPNSYNSTGHGYGSSTSSGTSASPASDNPASSGSGYSPSTGGGSSTSPSSLDLPDATSGASANLSPANNTSTAGFDPSGSGGGTAGTTGGGGFNTPSGGGAGASVPGHANSGPAAATAAKAADAAGNANSRMGSMMPHAGQKKEGEGDTEHKTPDYLRGVQEDLIGPDPRLLPGGVIGGDFAE